MKLCLAVLVDLDGDVILHDFVAPTAEVTDWRTSKTALSALTWSSSQGSHTRKQRTLTEYPERPIEFNIVQNRVRGIIQGRPLVGHSLWFDLNGETISIAIHGPWYLLIMDCFPRSTSIAASCSRNTRSCSVPAFSKVRSAYGTADAHVAG
jgi:hypothetical protein